MNRKIEILEHEGGGRFFTNVIEEGAPLGNIQCAYSDKKCTPDCAAHWMGHLSIDRVPQPAAHCGRGSGCIIGLLVTDPEREDQ